MKLEKPPIIIAAIMLALAVIPIWPYGYYVFLRLVVCGAAIYLAYYSRVSRLSGWFWLFVFLAVLFNPVIPVHLNRALWAVIDLSVAALFFLLIKKDSSKK